MPCIEAFVEIIWPSISSALEYFLQTTAGEALTRVRDWVIHRVCGEATPAPVILQLPNSPRSIVGIEEVLPKFRSFLDDDTCKIIGIYGRDGIGKTTLLQEINNEFFERKSRRFDLVKESRKILDRLGLDKESSDPKYKIYNALREKKFLLLRDNLWGKVNLGEIGIPVPPYLKEGSKIAFTTQSGEVCNDMGAARWKLKMPPLSEEKSGELFCQNLGMGEDRLTEYHKL